MRVPAVDQVGVRHQLAELFVAVLQIGIFDGDLGQTIRMRIHQLHTLAPGAGQGLRLRFLHGIQHGIQQVQRHHDQDARQRVAPLQLPGDAIRVARDLLRSWLRIHAIGFDVPLQAHVADRIGVRVGVFQVRPFSRVRIGEHHIRADFKSGADGLHEGIRGLDWNIDGPILFGLVRIEDH